MGRRNRLSQTPKYVRLAAVQGSREDKRTTSMDGPAYPHTRMKHDYNSPSPLGLICGFTVHRFLVMAFGIRKVHFSCVVHMHIATKASGIQEGIEEKEREASCCTVQWLQHPF
jgi:hypothetical protein